MTDLSPLDRYLPEDIRNTLETQFYARVNEQCRMENLVQDASFIGDPINHVGVFSDHGVVHVRDVAQQILDVLTVINGVLIPRRDSHRLDFFMRGCGVILAYLHDIGMCNITLFGRAIHPEFASQFVFSPDFTPLFNTIWEKNCGNIAWRLVNLASEALLDQPPQMILREILAMSNGHSKSKVPIATLNDPVLLRQTMMHVLSTDLNVLYLEHMLKTAEKAHHKHPDRVTEHVLKEAHESLNSALSNPNHSVVMQQHIVEVYSDFEHEAFIWLLSPHAKVQELRDDVIDTIRALRCADALRQRGTVLKTSGSYEIFVNQMSANAIYAMRLGHDQLYMLEIPSALGSGEANLAASELSPDGNLRISFHRGAFTSSEVTHTAATYAAVVVNDIQSDVIESFKRPDAASNGAAWPKTKILLENVDDNLEFADLILQKLETLNPRLIGLVQTVPSLQSATLRERTLYLQAPELTSTPLDLNELLQQLALSGQRIDEMNLEKAFHHVKLIHISEGTTLIEAATPASFVYIPLQEGLKVFPLGGYQSFSAAPWMPLGSTGVIRGAMRNASVICDQAMDLLMIPRDVYLRWWHKPYTPETLARRLSDV